jgi:arylsulfatase A-like enzyme
VRGAGRGPAALATLAALLLVPAAGCGPRRDAPDIVLITVDTLRADRLGAYGHDGATTPVFDGLAERGRLFSQATTPFPRTTPALASLFTGLEPRHHGSREVAEPRRSGTTLAQVLQARGYATIGVSSNGVAGAHENLHSGFEVFLEKEDLGTERGWKVTDSAVEAALAIPAERPLFLWAHYTDPHYTYNPPRDFDPGPEAEPCRELMSAVKERTVWKGQMQANHGGATAPLVPACALLYDAEVAYADTQVGRLLAGLGRAGRLDRAYLIYTSDHGENLGEAKLFFEHGPSVHDASLRVPLVISGPDVVPGRDAGLIRLQDLAPTLLSLAGVPPGERPPVDGMDLAARMRGTGDVAPPLALAEGATNMRVRDTARPHSGRPDDRYCFHDAPWSLCLGPNAAPALYDHRADPGLTRDLGDAHPQVRERLLAADRLWTPGELRERTARTADWKLVEYPRLEGGWRRALYALADDPGETRDVAAQNPQVVERLAAQLERWAATPLPAPGLSDSDLEALRALGYVEETD